ncbi:MAG TPA: hypothetical protein VMK65_10405 [Longimicrobiales bacterium]|nr:hypothetical protein [Longimicrobiales bacterium]
MAGTKAAAEEILRQIPSVLGACVHEDVNGNPREVHILVGSGADPRALSKDVRELLEERLAVPVDQRVISIAQLAANGNGHLEAAAEPAGPGAAGEAAEGTDRLALGATETRRAEGRVSVSVTLEEGEETYTGEASEPDVDQGLLRAAARAALLAATRASAHEIRFELDSLSVVQVMDRQVVLVTVSALAPRLGRRARTLVGAHPAAEQPDLGAILAVLKATNRTLVREG